MSLKKVLSVAASRRRIKYLLIISLVVTCVVYWKKNEVYIKEKSSEFNGVAVKVHKNGVYNIASRNSSNEVILKAYNCDTIHIAFVCSGLKSNLYIYTLLKSLLFHRTNPLHFHFLVNDFSEQVLRKLMLTWDISEVDTSFYNISKYIKKVQWVANNHYSGIYGLLKLVIPDILPESVGKIIVLDTDLLLAANILELWNIFDEMKDENALALVENQSNYYLNPKAWPALGRGFNSGVVLYNLEKIRKLDWYSMWSTITKRTALEYGQTLLGDQDVLNSVIINNDHLLYELPCYWNVQLSDHTISKECYEQYSIKVLHWNSPKKLDVINKDSEYFRNVYRVMLELNGYLVKKTLNKCTITTNTTKQNDIKDVCKIYKNADISLKRTLLFFRNYSYSNQSHDVTYVAQLSYERLQMVEDLCKYWEGPISLTFYLTDPEFQMVNKFIDNSVLLGKRTNIAYHVVFKINEFYPINYLRNIGLQNVDTPYVFLADIDFLPMINLYQTIRKEINLSGDLNKKALIIPAFESQRYKNKIPKNKNDLLYLMKKKEISPFRFDVWSPGHNPTNYTLWQTANTPYQVQWKPDFEPYVVVDKNVVEYDTRFIGFGWNKVSHIIELACLDYEFIVLHNAFILHRPHTPSDDISKFRASRVYRMCLQRFKEEFLVDLTKRHKNACNHIIVSNTDNNY